MTLHHRADSSVRVSRLVALTLLCVLFLPPSIAYAADVIYVDVATGSDLTGTGSASDPYKSIKKGLSEAAYGDIVRVANGTYSESASGEDFPLRIPRGVRLQGLGSGFMPGPEVDGNGTESVFEIVNGNMNTVLDGFYITRGGGTNGAGVLILGGSSPGYGPSIQRNYITNNSATGRGGGIYMNPELAPDFSPLIQANYLVGNSASAGGGIFASGTTLDLYRNIFLLNESTGSGAGDGGGGVFAATCGGNIERCIFYMNEASSNGDGGAIDIDGGGTVSVRNSRLVDNRANLGGGIYTTGASSVGVYDSLLSSNTASFGGAAYTHSNTIFSRSTIVGNEAGLGDGVRNNNATLGLSNVILWDNGGDDIENFSGSVFPSYSCIQEATWNGTGVIHSNPYFRDPTNPFDRFLAYYSPCIDTGNPTSSGGRDILQVLRPKDGDGNGSARIDMGAYEYWLDVDRTAGDDRYETAAQIYGENMPFSHYAVIATGLDFPDALCASGLAGLYNAPILLTYSDHLPDAAITVLFERQVYEVFIVGGSGVVSDSVVAQLESMDIEVTRLAGVDRYETARLVADHIADNSVSIPSTCLIARGDLFPDALALAPIAWRTVGAVLLVRPESVPPPTRAALDANDYDKALIAGGEAAVSSSVEDVVKAYVPPAEVKRLAGVNRYETAVAVAEYAIDEALLSPDFFGIATGADFPDALAGGAVCGYKGGPLLLSLREALHPSAHALIHDHRYELQEIQLFGGTGVLADTVADECSSLMP